MEAEDQAVVVPLTATPAEVTTEVLLRMLVNREAILIDRPAADSPGTPSGLVAQASGAFAKAISQAAGTLGRTAGNSDLYRVVMPTGAVARDLIPAIGGGFRGIVRAAGSTRISGHVRLIPAVAGAGATVAAGPLIATVGLAVAGEMLAQHQTHKKLDSIKNSLTVMQARSHDHERSILATAAQQTRKVAGYLLDQAHLPSISSAAHAFGDLDTLTNAYIDRLDRWRVTASKFEGAEHVTARELLFQLVSKPDDPIREFERAVAQTYEALALRARVVVLEKVAAEFSNPDRSLPHVESVLRTELFAIAERQQQLVELLDDLTVMTVDSSKVPLQIAGKGAIALRTSFSTLARALHSAPDGLPILSESDQTVLELSPAGSGLSVLAPDSNAART